MAFIFTLRGSSVLCGASVPAAVLPSALSRTLAAIGSHQRNGELHLLARTRHYQEDILFTAFLAARLI